MLIILVSYVLGFAAAWCFWWGLTAQPVEGEAGVVLLFGGAGVGLSLEMIASSRPELWGRQTVLLRRRRYGVPIALAVAAGGGVGSLCLSALWTWILGRSLWLILALALTPPLGLLVVLYVLALAAKWRCGED